MSDTVPTKIARAGISSIPIEILEWILDFLYDDRAALFSSSLVSREWVSGPRYHLFNPTIINEFHLPYRGFGVIKENVSSFLPLVQAPYCTILPAIQNVVLNITTPELIKTVVEELKRSKALTQILFVGHTHTTESASVSWIADALPDIRDFSYNASNEFGVDACRLVASFPRLQCLAIYTQVRTILTFPAHISGSHFLHLRTLRLKLVNSEQFLIWLQSLDGWHSALETLDLRIFCSSHVGWGPVNALNSFLKANSDTLKYLSIGIDYTANLSEDISDQETQIDLSALSNLSSVFFRTHDINAICGSLASLSPSSNLEVLTVHALPWRLGSHLLPGECDLPELLGRLASIMEGSQSFGSNTLHLCVPRNLRSSELDSVAELFRAWRHRDALKLSYVEEDDYQINTRDSIRHLVFKRERAERALAGHQ